MIKTGHRAPPLFLAPPRASSLLLAPLRTSSLLFLPTRSSSLPLVCPRSSSYLLAPLCYSSCLLSLLLRSSSLLLLPARSSSLLLVPPSPLLPLLSALPFSSSSSWPPLLPLLSAPGSTEEEESGLLYIRFSVWSALCLFSGFMGLLGHGTRNGACRNKQRKQLKQRQSSNIHAFRSFAIQVSRGSFGGLMEADLVHPWGHFGIHFGPHFGRFLV